MYKDGCFFKKTQNWRTWTLNIKATKLFYCILSYRILTIHLRIKLYLSELIEKHSFGYNSSHKVRTFVGNQKSGGSFGVYGQVYGQVYIMTGHYTYNIFDIP